MQLTANTFFITGGSSGLGAACARRFAQAGGNGVIADVNLASGEALAEERGEQALFVPTDVTSETAVKAAVDTVVDRFQGIQGAINCAGIGPPAKVVGRDGVHDLGQFTKVIQVNLIGTFNVIRLVAAAMVQNEPNDANERGVIINTASVAAFDGQIGQAAYSASKGGVVGMTLPIARELARHGIRVMTIAPGIFDTPMLAGLPEKARLSLGQQDASHPQRAGLGGQDFV